MAADHIIYCLERVTDYDQFERLCQDLMVRNGYPDIEPLGGTKDKGRDALHVSRQAPSEVTVFAYSVREDWRKKLDEDCRKIQKHGHECHRLAFLCTADHTASQRDQAVASVQSKFGWELELYGLERLRVLLTAAMELIPNHPQVFPPSFFPYPGRPWLTLIPVRRRLKHDPVTSEIQLLDAYRRAIEELVGREQDLADLWAWLHEDERPIAVRVVTGRAGAGKTRLAIEVLLRLEEERPVQWWAGFLTSEELSRFVAAQNLSAWTWGRPTLAVMDYAATAGQALERCLRELAEKAAHPPDAPLRLLLLEREASAEEGWFRALLDRSFTTGDRVRAFFDSAEPIRPLQKLQGAGQRRRVFQAMLEAAGKHLGLDPPPLPPPEADPIVDRQLEARDWEDPLYLMMAALMASHYEDVVKALSLSRTDLARDLAAREIDRIERFAADGGKSAKRLLRLLAAYATLGGGMTEVQAVQAAKQEAQVRGLAPRDGCGALVMQLHEALPAPDRSLAPIQPDIIAEALVLDVLKQEPSELRADTVLRAAGLLGAAVPKLVILTTQDYCRGDELEPLEWLEKLIQAGVADDPGLLAAIDDALPHAHQTLVLREKAVEVSQHLLERVWRLAGELPDDRFRSQRARLLGNLGVRFSALGRLEEALGATEEALRLYRQLAEARPDAFLPDLTISLSNLGNRLSALGRLEEALAATEEAVRLDRQLTKARPDAFLSYLASSLSNLASDLSALGRREEALGASEEAVRIRRQLAEARPDAFLPDLATSLNNLGVRFSALGRLEEALAATEEAVRIRRRLAGARPEAFLPDLATSLNNLGLSLRALGRREEALVATQEAVRLCRQLAEARPEAFLPDLARSLGARGAALRAMERHAPAARSFREGIKALLAPFENLPGTFAQLMDSLFRDYLNAVKCAEESADEKLVARVSAVFEQLRHSGCRSL